MKLSPWVFFIFGHWADNLTTARLKNIQNKLGDTFEAEIKYMLRILFLCFSLLGQKIIN